MLKRKNGQSSWVLASLFPALVSLVLSPAATKAGASSQADEKVYYYVISNTTDSQLRTVYILMDEADFTEPRLRRLMDQLRLKHPEPGMWGFLYSKLDQLYDFYGNEPSTAMGRINAGKAPRPWNKNASGILICRGDDQLIRYNTAGSERRTIVVRGVDPAAPKR